MAGTIEVVLLTDVVGTGKRGDIVRVSTGFAHNKLFPSKFAVLATAQVVQKAVAEKRRVAAAGEQALHSATALVQRLEALHVTMHMDANEKGTLYGAVRASAIAAALRKAGCAVQDAWVVLKESVTTLGEHAVTVHVPRAGTATVRVSVLNTKTPR